MNAIVPASNAESYRLSTDAAGMCREIVLKTAQNIQGRKYVKVEGWQAIAIAHGCAASADHVERVNDEGMSGFKATGIIRRMSDGVEIARAEGFLGDDEGTWNKRPVYARRAMVQTRAISRACRSAFAHVVVLIDSNLSTTPAEEVPMGGFDDDRPPPAARAPKPEAAQEPVIEGEYVPVQGRKSAAQAKRDGDATRINTNIDAADVAWLDQFEDHFDELTAELPFSWLDPLRNRIILRREEIAGAANVAEAEAELDGSFRGAIGSGSPDRMAGNDRQVAAA